MPYSGTGIFTRVYQWANDAAGGINVDASRTDTDSNDIADGLTNCITRDGQSPAVANIPLGGFKITGLGIGAAATDGVNYGQVFTNPSTFTGLLNFTSGSTGTGVINFAGATSVSVPTVATADNSTKAASTAYVTAKAFAAALPAQSLGFLRSDGAVTAFTQAHTGYAQNEVKGADIASAATINLTTATGNFVHVTGTAQITAITIPVGAERTVIFDGALILTHGAALLLPGAANIVTAANDRMIVRGDTAGAIVTSYTKAIGAATAAVPYLHVREEQASGTNGGASISGVQVRVLNTTVGTNTIVGASLASNMVTLPAGTYDFEASAPGSQVTAARLTLYNNTDGVDVMLGPSQYADTAVNTGFDTQVFCSGRFTLAASKVLKLNFYTTSAVATYGLGNAAGSGQAEVYSSLKLWRVA